MAEVFDVDIVSKYEPQYWGFETQEEWDEFQEKISREDEEKFHVEILNYLRREPNDIKPGTVGMMKAQIAKTLVENDASLLLPINNEKLFKEMDIIYDRDHVVTFTLGPQAMALAQMIVTHEDDLPEG